MADIPSTSPDNGYIDQNIKPTSHYERTLGKEYQVQSKEIGGVIIDTKNGILKIVKKAEIKLEAKKETKELKEIEGVFQALENKDPNFDRENFKIKISGLTKEEIDFLGYHIYLLYSKDGKLLSYIKDNGEVLLDMTKFNPYMDSFEKNMMEYIGIEIGIGKDGKWYIKYGNGKWQETKAGKKYKIKKEIIDIEGSTEFDRYIISKYILKK